jgi:GT2 family glycosyltransferase
MENFKNIKEEPPVSIIILNWNGWQDTIECLESVYQIDYSNYNVIVVDNASTDHSIKKIKEYCEGKIEVESKFFKYKNGNKPIKVIEHDEEELNEKFNKFKGLILLKNHKNYGFAEGNNKAIQYALKNLKNDYILLLNNDTVVDKEFLTQLVNIAKNKKIGFVGPKTYYYEFNGGSNVIGFAGGILNRRKCQLNPVGKDELDEGQYDQSKKVDYVEGSCLLIKKEIIKEIGCFDSDYFTYWEEVDWCIRGIKADYISFYSPKAKIWHKTRASEVGASSIYYMIKNRFLFIKKNKKDVKIASSLIYFFGYYFWIIFGSVLIIHKSHEKCLALITGTFDGVKILLKDL